MAIIKFQPNVPQRLFLTRTDSSAAPSNFPDAGTQYQWHAKNHSDERLTFYAGAALNDRLIELAHKHTDILNREIEIIKAVQNNQATWIVRFVGESAPATTQATTTSEAPKANGNSDDVEKTSGVQRMVRLWMQCYLEMSNANSALNGHGLAAEELRQATTSVFIAATSKGFTANAERIKLLLDEFKKQAEQKKPVITPKEIQEEFKELMNGVTQPTPTSKEVTYEYDEPVEAPPSTNGPAKLSSIKVKSLLAAAEKKHISPDTLLAELRMRLNYKNLTRLEDLPERDFMKACSAVAQLKIE